jgi:glycosyltransferase involved in cell wall biosynthesis
VGLISAIIPTYNRSEMLGDAIDSVLGQTYDNIEVIIVDDGSTDNTSEVVNNYLQQSKMPIRFFRKQNGGCASARNYGIVHAAGEFIAFLDSDDRWLPDALETLLAKLQHSNGAFIYSPSIEVFSEKHQKLIYPCAKDCPDKFAVEHFKWTNTRPGAVLYRRSIFETVRGFDENLKYNEDSDFLQRVAINFKAAYSPLPTVKVYHHEGSKSKKTVDVNRALLQSSENILFEFPDFAKSLGKIAEERVVSIKTNLIRSLILNQKFDDAKDMINEVRGISKLSAELSLRFCSNLPVSFECFVVKMIKKCRRAILRVY